jgi:hypothetical protein
MDRFGRPLDSVGRSMLAGEILVAPLCGESPASSQPSLSFTKRSMSPLNRVPTARHRGELKLIRAIQASAGCSFLSSASSGNSPVR